MERTVWKAAKSELVEFDTLVLDITKWMGNHKEVCNSLSLAPTSLPSLSPPKCNKRSEIWPVVSEMSEMSEMCQGG